MSGMKYDQEKVRLELIPPDFILSIGEMLTREAAAGEDPNNVSLELIPPELLLGVGKVLDFGAQKYGSRNWEKGIEWGRVYGALQRHLNAWWSGEECDAETGKSHLWHAGCCLAFLMAYEQRVVGEDDRPKQFVEPRFASPDVGEIE